MIAAILAAEIFLGWGLWTLRPWAFWATVVVEVINVLSGLYSLFAVHNGQTSGFFNLIVGLVILIYMFADRNVRAAFRT